MSGARQYVRRAAQTIARRAHAFIQTAVENDLPRFANTPKNLRIELPRRIFEAHCFHIGDDVQIGPGALLVAQTYYPTEIMQHPGRSYPIQRFEPRLTIGDRVTSTAALTLAAMHTITIENDVMLAGNVLISDGSHGFEHVDDPYKYQPMCRIAPVTIKRGCWLGQNVVVMPGVTIGEMSIIGANSVVTSNIPARSIAIGAPARVVKRWDAALGAWRRVDQLVTAD